MLGSNQGLLFDMTEKQIVVDTVFRFRYTALIDADDCRDLVLMVKATFEEGLYLKNAIWGYFP